MKFLIHEEARFEAVDGADYYESQQLGLGTRFTEIVASHLLKVERSPQRYAKLETTRLRLTFAVAFSRSSLISSSTRFAKISSMCSPSLTQAAGPTIGWPVAIRPRDLARHVGWTSETCCA